MSIFVFAVPTFTPTAVADAANYTDAGYFGLMGGGTTQRIKIKELFLGGLATSSAPTIMLLARDSTVQATPTALATPNSSAPVDAAAAAYAAVPVAFVASTTKPQRSNSTTVSKLGVFNFNAFGGLIRKEYAPGEEPTLIGNTASLGEISVSAFTGTVGIMGGHLVFEPM